MRDALTRRVLPRAVVALSQVDGPARIGAAARRRFGRGGRVELFFAFDDPLSAVAVTELAALVAGRDVQLVLLPVVERGIAGDPAVDQKRRYAIVDARRLARRRGLVLSRDEPLPPDSTAFLAEWVATAAQGPALVDFCVEAVHRLWFATDPSDHADYAALWRERFGGHPPAAGGAAAVRGNEQLMRRRRPYDTPAAWVHGQWFFAHERVMQIGERLDSLGWTASR